MRSPHTAMRPILLSLAIAWFSTPAAAAPADRQQIDRAISVLAGQFSDGIAVGLAQYRHIAFGRIFGGERDDAVALFSVEGYGGTNYHAEYLAFFASVPPEKAEGRKTRPFRLVAVIQVGGRGWRTFDYQNMMIRPQGVSCAAKLGAIRTPAAARRS
jgi:hypothetical protein